MCGSVQLRKGTGFRHISVLRLYTYIAWPPFVLFGPESIQICFSELNLSFWPIQPYQIWLKEAKTGNWNETRPNFQKPNLCLKKCFQLTTVGDTGGAWGHHIAVSLFLSLSLSRSLYSSLSLPLYFAFVFVFASNSPRLVTLVVRVVQVVDVHLELNTDGNIVPSESE